MFNQQTIKQVSIHEHFASTTHPDTHRDKIGRVGQPSRRAIYSMSTEATKTRKLRASSQGRKPQKTSWWKK